MAFDLNHHRIPSVWFYGKWILILKQNPHAVFPRELPILCAQIADFRRHWSLETMFENRYCQTSLNITSCRAGKLKTRTANSTQNEAEEMDRYQHEL